MFSSRKQLALALLVALSVPPPSLAGGAGPLPLAAPLSGLALDRTYAGEGFTLRYPRAYTVRPFTGGLALVQAGRGDVLTTTELARPGNARQLPPASYARQFAPLNIQGAGALINFVSFKLPDGTPVYRGTWHATAGISSVLGPLYLVPLDPEAQHWLVLSAADAEHRPLLDAIAHHIIPLHVEKGQFGGMMAGPCPPPMEARRPASEERDMKSLMRPCLMTLSQSCEKSN